MGFIADIQEKYKTVSIVGMAKNAGKWDDLVNGVLPSAYAENRQKAIRFLCQDPIVK